MRDLSDNTLNVVKATSQVRMSDMMDLKSAIPSECSILQFSRRSWNGQSIVEYILLSLKRRHLPFGLWELLNPYWTQSGWHKLWQAGRRPAGTVRIFEDQEVSKGVLSRSEAVLVPQSSVLNPQSSVLIPQFSVLNPWSSVLNPWSSVLNPRSSVLNSRSSILNP